MIAGEMRLISCDIAYGIKKLKRIKYQPNRAFSSVGKQQSILTK